MAVGPSLRGRRALEERWSRVLRAAGATVVSAAAAAAAADWVDGMKESPRFLLHEGAGLGEGAWRARSTAVRCSPLLTPLQLSLTRRCDNTTPIDLAMQLPARQASPGDTQWLVQCLVRQTRPPPEEHL
jgi:hypothetical protein